MELNSLYEVINKEKIDIDNMRWSKGKARIFEIDNNYSIAIDYSKIENSSEEKQILAEELGHYYSNSLYYLNDDIYPKSKCEYKAKKWAYFTLIPFHLLKKKIQEGLSIYELADFFDVNVEYLNNCIIFYLSKYGKF